MDLTFKSPYRLKYHNKTTSTIVDLEEINKKEIITSIDIILSMCEICLNQEKYKIPGSSKSRLFWLRVFEHEAFNKILVRHKPETLCKYCVLIQKHSVVSKFIQILNEINSFNCSLKSLK